MSANTAIPALDFAPDSFFVVESPDSSQLPLTNSYAPDLTPEQVCLIIAGILALAGLTVSAATLETNAAQYSCLTADEQNVAFTYMLNQVLLNIPQNATNGGGVYAGNYSGVAPSFTPPTASAIAIDSVTKQQWAFVSGTWS